MRRAAPNTVANAVGGVQTNKAYQVYYRGAKKKANTARMQDDVWPQAIFADPQANNTETTNPPIAHPFVTYGDITFQMENPSFFASGIYPKP